VHRKVLAVSRINRWRIDTEQAKTTSEQGTDARFGESRPIFREGAAGDGSSGTEQQALDEWQRLDLLQILHLDLLGEAGDVNDYGRAVESVQQELVRAGPSFPNM